MSFEYHTYDAEEGAAPVRRHRRSPLQPFKDEGSMRRLRNWLNIVFIVGALAGMACFMWADREVGVYVLIGASVFKFVELTLRLMKL